MSQLKDKVFIPEKNLFLKIFYNNQIGDTLPLDLVLQQIEQVKNQFKVFIPDFLEDFTIEIWNASRKDCPKKALEFFYKKKKIIVTTAYLDQNNDKDIGWHYIICQILGHYLLTKFQFRKETFVKKKWRDLRQGYNIHNPEETFINDFTYLFTYLATVNKKNITGTDPNNLLGLRHLYFLWNPLLEIKKSWDPLLLYRRFVSIPGLHYLGFIYTTYNYKLKKVTWNKMTTQGFWLYNELNDQFELTHKFI